MTRARPAAQQPDWLTPERAALLRTLWPAKDLTVPEIRQRLSALPGPDVPAPDALRWQAARRLRLPNRRHRPRGPRAAKDLPQDPALDGLWPQDIAEARVLLRRPSTDASYLAEYFGWPPDRAVTVAAILRDDLASADRDKARA
ncbi:MULTISPECIES: hypothetical protein [Roseomonadaceae]|uniref:Uncharacterized protein n=1 Tax=Falsiroseomonas oleicola TaxID=2801474 RepID=A0ABS6H9H3_9PROT|nr:hypothetical protein [Roseomonas oleicola]MBU8543970.1 hypothetical protein [Roseomonas oleicola]